MTTAITLGSKHSAYLEASAVISPCTLYRYRLFRRWGLGPVCTFIMLNPSTADGKLDDPTIRRCVGFAKREGCGALLVVNLFAFRATEPDDLLLADDPFGPDGVQHLREAVEETRGPVVAAWGAWAGAREPGKVIADRFHGRLVCLGTTKDGSPRHPLYVRADAPLVPL
jgi:hypothetical protein